MPERTLHDHLGVIRAHGQLQIAEWLEGLANKDPQRAAALAIMAARKAEEEMAARPSTPILPGAGDRPTVGIERGEGEVMSGGTKLDADKPRTDLIPPEPLIGAAKVFAFGANKYSARNWEQGISYGRLYGALLRHVLAWWGGEEQDPESGKHHLSHAMCCLMMLHATAHRVNHGQLPEGLDDRAAISAFAAGEGASGDPVDGNAHSSGSGIDPNTSGSQPAT